jgi:hypothetical protein
MRLRGSIPDGSGRPRPRCPTAVARRRRRLPVVPPERRGERRGAREPEREGDLADRAVGRGDELARTLEPAAYDVGPRRLPEHRGEAAEWNGERHAARARSSSASGRSRDASAKSRARSTRRRTSKRVAGRAAPSWSALRRRSSPVAASASDASMMCSSSASPPPAPSSARNAARSAAVTRPPCGRSVSASSRGGPTHPGSSRRHDGERATLARACSRNPSRKKTQNVSTSRAESIVRE